MIFGLTAAALAACSQTPPPGPPIVTFVPKGELAELRPAATPPATEIGVDDVLEVVYLKQYVANQAAYKFDVGDALELQFYTRTEPPQTYAVQPDGRIYLPEIGYLTVRGLTADEIELRVRKGYSRTRLAGPVNVVARTTDAKVNEMIGTLAKSNNGATRTARVLADGTISLPLLDLVPVAGRTLGEVQTDINERYGKMFNNLHVSIDLRETNSRRFGVLGEVKTPGIYPYLNHTTLLDALTRAGGILESGKAYNVIVIRPNPDGVQVAEINAETDARAVGKLTNWQMEPSDIVYVPRSHITDVGLWVKQYIRDVLPIPLSTSFFYGFNATVR